VGSISESSLLMLRLVNDIFDLSKTKTQVITLQDLAVDLHRLLQNLEVNKKHGDKVDFSKDVPRNIYGDSNTRVQKIVYNLLSLASLQSKD
jgi:signal transduction histidine kinase